MQPIRIRADLALNDPDLWADILEGRKVLVWRIGHRLYTIVDYFKTDEGKLVVTFHNGREMGVKPATLLTVHCQPHPYYAGKAGELLFLLQAQVGEQIRMSAVEVQGYAAPSLKSMVFQYWFVKENRPKNINFTVDCQQFETESMDKLVEVGAKMMGHVINGFERLEKTI